MKTMMMSIMSTTKTMQAARGKIIFRLALKSNSNKFEYQANDFLLWVGLIAWDGLRGCRDFKAILSYHFA